MFYHCSRNKSLIWSKPKFSGYSLFYTTKGAFYRCKWRCLMGPLNICEVQEIIDNTNNSIALLLIMKSIHRNSTNATFY